MSIRFFCMAPPRSQYLRDGRHFSLPRTGQSRTPPGRWRSPPARAVRSARPSAPGEGDSTCASSLPSSACGTTPESGSPSAIRPQSSEGGSKAVAFARGRGEERRSRHMPLLWLLPGLALVLTPLARATAHEVAGNILINRDSGRNVGAIAQLHIFLDDLFPTSIGLPLIGGPVAPATPF